jgi:hypothetical protein
MSPFDMLARTTRPSLLLCAALALAAPATAQAKINIANSLEWHCARAEIIVRGRVTRIRDRSGGGKSRDLISMTFKVSEALKGAKGQQVLYISARQRDFAAFKRLVEKVDLLLFLRRTQQGYNLDGQSYHLWPVRDQGGEQLLVNLAAPGKTMLSAARFKVLDKARPILAACRAALRKLGSKRSGGPQRRFLDVPPKTSVFRALYQGSACYLVVPARLFSKARKKL